MAGNVGVRGVSIVASLAVFAVGCGHKDTAATQSSPTTASTASEVVFPTPTETDVNKNGIPDSEPTDKDWPGKMNVVYEDATTPEAIRGRKFMEENNLLPQLADDINSTLKLPFDIPLKGSQCGVANDWWSPGDKAMTMCYEDVAENLDMFQEAGFPDPTSATFHTAVAVNYHETGHMVIDIYDLPATGREEDVADQASVYLLLRPGDDGKIDQDSIDAIKDAAASWKLLSDKSNGEVTPDDLADVHSPSLARMDNILCWAYGADPAAMSDVVADGRLPQQRADGCDDEYQKLDHAWSTLLKPYLK
ncbi:hypothetical protein BayCH28_24815 [Mycolicibacterium sp. CH28]|nr:hypothetical protein BayCH28_24815 [Mycolicibacterium sp. CH28]